MIDNSKKICDLIRDCGITFGTSGARGLVDDFTKETCTAFTQAFFYTLKDKYVFNHVAIAIDNRPSSYRIAQYCEAALKGLSISTVFYGVIPTPALALKSMKDGVPCIMVTGSHIPFDRNGLKFYTPQGEIDKCDEKNIINCQMDIDCSRDTSDLILNDDAANEYVSRYVSAFPDLPLKGKNVGIYEHSSAGRDLYSIIFSKLGASVVSLGRSDVFVPIDTEAVSEKDKKQAQLWSNEFKLDAIFSTDGDGDRPLVADEKGHWLRGDILGLLASQALSIEHLAIPVSCNSAIEETGAFKSVVRTKIGSPYVIEAMQSLDIKNLRVAGFEANGGFLLASDIELNGHKISALPTRDAVLPAVSVMVNAFQTGNISSKVLELPKRYTCSDRIQNIPSAKSAKLLQYAITNPQSFIESLGFREFSVLHVNRIDGARFISDSGDVIHFRPSGNAPELRCYAESSSEDKALCYVTTALQKVAQIDWVS